MAVVRGLNRQNIDHPGAVWYVVSQVGLPRPDAAARGIEAALAGAPSSRSMWSCPKGAAAATARTVPSHQLPCVIEGP